MILTLTQYLAALTKEVQSLKKTQNNNRQDTNNIDKQTTYWDGVPFWEKPGWQLKYCWTYRSGLHEGKTCNSKKKGHKAEATYAKLMGGSMRRLKRRHY